MPPNELMEDVRALCAYEGRRTGTDAERRAANHLARRLREGGRRAVVEPTYVHPQVGLVLAAHCALGFVGSLLAVELPVVGFALVLFAATSLYLDLNTRIYLLRRLFFRRASQNVHSPGEAPGAPVRLLLVAHYDVARTGWIYGERRARALARLSRLTGFPASRLLFWSLAALVPALGARMAGVDAAAISAAQLPPTLILLVAAFLLVDIQLSDPVPGANDNASGVAVLLGLARELRDQPLVNLDVELLFTGGEECLAEGMRAFLRSHGDELAARPTYVLVLDSVGAGDVRFLAGDGMAVTYAMDRRLLELCHAIGHADAEAEGSYSAAALRGGSVTAALAARVRGLPATLVTCVPPGAPGPPHRHLPSDTPERVEPQALARARDFTLELARALDREAGRPPAGG